MEKVWNITHGDADGICSSALVHSVFKGVNMVFSNPSDLCLALREVPEGVTTVIITDIAVNEADVEKLKELLTELGKTKRVVYIDHHPLPKGFDSKELPVVFVHRIGPCTSELTFKHFSCSGASEERIMLMGAIADYADNTPFVRRKLAKWDKRTLYFEAGFLVNGLEGLRRSREEKERVTKFLASGRPPSEHTGLVGAALMLAHVEEEMKKRIKESVKKVGEVSYVLEPKGPLGKAATYARAEGGTLVGVAVELNNARADLSIRTSSKLVDLSEIVPRVAAKYGGTGGGHPRASGAKIPMANLKDFLKDMAGEVERVARRAEPA